VAQEIKAWYVRTLKGKPASRGRKRGEAHVLESVYPHLADAIADVEATGRASAEELVNALHARGIDVDKQLVEYWETRGYLIRQGRGWVVRFPL
jgi:hypothetical protein